MKMVPSSQKSNFPVLVKVCFSAPVLLCNVERNEGWGRKLFLSHRIGHKYWAKCQQGDIDR